jgi:hypothetical protein
VPINALIARPNKSPECVSSQRVQGLRQQLAVGIPPVTAHNHEHMSQLHERSVDTIRINTWKTHSFYGTLISMKSSKIRIECMTVVSGHAPQGLPVSALEARQELL